jgi:O2-independent ubiquinone biosynthesis accessory factor UbiT
MNTKPGATGSVPSTISGAAGPLPPEQSLLQRAAARASALVRRLPPQPPSFVAARLLDRVLLPRLDESARAALSHRTVELELFELGLRVRLRLGARGFEVAPSRDVAALRILARSAAMWRLLRGEDDADRLFFERALIMEGDTEYGLILKNALDAIGPLWPGR